MDFLAGLFGGDPPVVSRPAGQQPMPEAAIAGPMPVEIETNTPVPVAIKPPALPLGGDSWPGEPCPKCRGLLWWEDLEGRRHCLDCERERFERAEELVRVAQRLRTASGLPPWGAEAEPEPPAPGELRCGRCGGVEVVEATTHGGRTVRGDCAGCGRFIGFTLWYGRLLQPGAN